MQGAGTFSVELKFESPHDVVEAVALARADGDKKFVSGPLSGSSRVEMLSCRDGESGAAAYVALERFNGILEGKSGGFVLMHSGVMTKEAQTLAVSVVPGSGTGELKGIAGSMTIEIEEGSHRYGFEWTI